MPKPKNKPKRGTNAIEYNIDGTIKNSFLKATWNMKDWRLAQNVLRDKAQNGDKGAAMLIIQMMGGTPAPNRPENPSNPDPVTEITFEVVQGRTDEGKFDKKPKNKEYKPKVDETKVAGDEGILREREVPETDSN